jgi:hypothetical protein
MGAQIPVITEKPLTVCGYRKFKIDTLGDHLCTCTSHSGAKKAHDWAVDQLADLFRTTHRLQTQQVVKRLGHHCGDIELAGYLANATDPVPLVLDLRLAHDRFGSSSDPTLHGRLHYKDIDKSLNEDTNDKIRKYRLTLSRLCRLLLVRMDVYIVTLSDFYSYSLIGKLTAFLQLQEFSQRNQTWELRTSTFGVWLS